MFLSILRISASNVLTQSWCTGTCILHSHKPTGSINTLFNTGGIYNNNNNNNNLLCSCEITVLIHLLAILFAVDESTAIVK